MSFTPEPHAGAPARSAATHAGAPARSAATLTTAPPASRSDVMRWAIVAVLFGLSVLPLFQWLPVDIRATVDVAEDAIRAARYGRLIDSWFTGSSIVLGGAIVMVILARRMPGLWREGWIERRLARASMAKTGMLIAVAAAVVYALVSYFVFDRRPMLIDEIAELMQAQIFAQGRLWVPSGPYPEFFSSMLMVDADGRHFSQFLPGTPALLTLGMLAGAPWLVGPVCGATAVGAFHDFLRTIGERRTVLVGATLVFAFAPFAVFLAGSHMNHVPTLMWLMLAIAGLARTITRPERAWATAALTGFALGAAATIRPFEAFAFGLPAGLWLLALTVRRRMHWTVLAASGVALALPVALALWANAETTGAALRFGYDMQWGKGHGLGFHEAPWGAPHTPLRGLARMNLYLIRLHEYFLELPIPSFLPALAAFGLTRRLGVFDRYLIVSAALLMGLYFLYWFDGDWLGPRYYHALLPVLALWTARLPAAVRERWGRGHLYRGVAYGALVACLVSVTTNLRYRVQQYATMMPSLRVDADTIAERAGVRDALVFVRETWGAQLLVRMWALDIPRQEAEFLYYRIDACQLEHALTRLESEGVRGADARQHLRVLTADSARLVESPVSHDESERYLPGARYSERCVQRIRQDLAGTAALAPQMISRAQGNIYARDLHERNRLLVAQHPERPLYLLHAADTTFGAPLRLVPLARDSALRAWGAAAAKPPVMARRDESTAASGDRP